MKPTAMHKRSADKDDSPATPATSTSTSTPTSTTSTTSTTNPSTTTPTTPKYSSTITVGRSKARTPASITSPLQRRLSGEWTEVVDDRNGLLLPSTGRGVPGAKVSVLARADRKTMPTLIASRDQQREPIMIKSSSVATPPTVKPPLLPLSARAPSANPPQASLSTSQFKSAIHREPSSSVVAAASSASFSSSFSPPLPVRTTSSGGGLPRSNSGGSAVVSPDLSSVRVNGHSDSSMDSDADAYHLTDFVASLPSLPADEFASERQPPSSSTQSPVKVSAHPSTQQQQGQQQQQQAALSEPRHNSNSNNNNNISPYSEASLSTHTPSSPNSPLQSSETKAPKPSPRKQKKAPKPPLMTGIAENGASVVEVVVVGEGKVSDGDPNLRVAEDVPSETFHVNVRNTPALSREEGGLLGEGGEEVEEASFAGQRDLRDARSLREKQILSSKGTVRGFRNRVRAGIATFVGQASKKFNYRAAERGQIVMYMTSMTVVRETYDRCKSTRNILHTHMVPYEQRDVYLSHDNQRQLRERLDSAHEVPLPQIFIDGLHLGGATELEKLNESGELRKILHRFPKIQVRGQCDACGGFRYVPCGVCHGSKKSLHRNHFTEEFSALRCTSCNENGLQRCPHCLHHAE